MFNNDAHLESKNSGLSKAKSAKKGEFYTQYNDIEKEMHAYTLTMTLTFFEVKLSFYHVTPPIGVTLPSISLKTLNDLA